MKQSVRMAGTMLVVSTFAGLLHAAVWLYLDVDLQGVYFAESYLGNGILATALLLALVNSPKKWQSGLGFLFLFGSVFKFIFFFVFLLPRFRADGDMSKIEFFTFFVPYCVCLITETKLLISKLSRE